MGQVFITKKQLINLFETGAANAAMDLDIYVQPVSHDTSNGNNDVVEILEKLSDEIEEINNMLKNGKKPNQSQKNEIFKVFDSFNKIYNSIKTTE